MWLLWLRDGLRTSQSLQTGFRFILSSFCSSPQFVVSWFTNAAMSSSLSPVPALIKDLPQMWVQTKSLFKTSEPVHDWRLMGNGRVWGRLHKIFHFMSVPALLTPVFQIQLSSSHLSLFLLFFPVVTLLL